MTQLLTVPQVADRMALSEYTVRQMLRAGELAASKRGARWLVPETSITAWVEAHVYVP